MTASAMRARRLAASAPASVSTEVASATLDAARIACVSLATSASIASSASRTRIADDGGKVARRRLHQRDFVAAPARRPAARR